MEFLIVTQVDHAGEEGEAAYFFDPEDLDTAIAELDRLHTRIERADA